MSLADELSPTGSADKANFVRNQIGLAIRRRPVIKQAMRTLFYFLVVAVVIAVAVIYSMLAYASSTLDDSGKTYVEANIHGIIDHWSVDELTKRESEDFRQATSDLDLISIFARYKKLGSTLECSGITGHASIDPTKSGLKTTATYIATAKCENGRADIKVSLIQINGEWKILGFRVTSPLFAP